MLVIGVLAVVLLAMAVWLHSRRGPTGIDVTAARLIHDHLGGVREDLLSFSDPSMVLGAGLVIAYGAAVRRQWDLALLAAVVPLATAGLSSLVLKPLIDRQFSGPSGARSLGFPSGHETTLVATAVVLVIALGRLRPARGWLLGGVAIAAAWMVVGAVGLVDANHHFATDTVGGFAVGASCALGAALLLDGSARGREPGPVRH